MKRTIAVLALLALPVAAFGQSTVTLALVSGGSATVDVVGPVAANALDLTFESSVTGDPIDGLSFGFDVSVNGGAPSSGILAWGANTWTSGALFIYPGDNVAGNGMGAEFAGGDIVPPSQGGSWAGEAWFKNFGAANPPGSSATYHVTNMMPLQVGDVIVITPAGGDVNQPGFGPQCTAPGATCDLVPEGLTVNIIPEPASALLLLAAVPFFRRRR